MGKCVLIIGGNLGDREEMLEKTCFYIEEQFGAIIKKSSIYETAAWGGKSSGNYLNQVLLIQTDESPLSVLEKILEIENLLGRTRAVKWGDRTMDIDILYFDEKVIETENLTIPHPHISNRRFVLVPLAEILPDLFHPVFKATNLQLLNICEDVSEVRVYKEKPGDYPGLNEF
ncbi:2-amino-4-hydroxy-6- hydroxymethyldihydropteridine pyrophosphokinase [Indibacter alkaliphilus LW1]|uniref:2-amino-4-hydroxy-6-hydroxymethyldihydropteridine pyrophosphokinase n=1 Tax=Indibacter alkaliphilus (strain CCUG 57479 / KCTC 22604 / LW1) TaxID=1189612 RepID=S2DI83_INDAL|nr:2-amino-4-hydroxy-6-hydroxymethyldihydropteridine diphosphokinase [Indibacter alkaliphilus]EOZ96910.1 2-amino-4-hydroxy-6- hydroxymethyldihydropteridine pyrophosphokinase [Indibacter alkaliphilus LW1]